MQYKNHIASLGILLSIEKSFTLLVEKEGRKRDGKFWVTPTTKICQTQMRLLWLRRNSAHNYQRHWHTLAEIIAMKTGWQQCFRDPALASTSNPQLPSLLFLPKKVIHKLHKTMLIWGSKVIIITSFPSLKGRYGKGSVARLPRVKAC